MKVMHITRLYFECGQIVLSGKLTIKHRESDWSRTIETLVSERTGPKNIQVPEGTFELHHEKTVAVSLTIIEGSQVPANGKTQYFRSEAKITGTGKCKVCNKQMTRKMAFYQHSSPFNLNPSGRRKTREQMRREVQAEALDWANNHLIHAKCES